MSSQPLSLQATRVLSACTVIDLTPYKAELYSFLAPAVRESEGGLLMLAEGYSKVMKDAIGCLSSSDQCSSSYVALMGQVQEKIKLMHKVHTHKTYTFEITAKVFHHHDMIKVCCI